MRGFLRMPPTGTRLTVFIWFPRIGLSFQIKLFKKVFAPLWPFFSREKKCFLFIELKKESTFTQFSHIVMSSHMIYMCIHFCAKCGFPHFKLLPPPLWETIVCCVCVLQEAMMSGMVCLPSFLFVVFCLCLTHMCTYTYAYICSCHSSCTYLSMICMCNVWLTAPPVRFLGLL